MWRGCQVVGAARSAQIGTASSASTRIRMLTAVHDPGTHSRRIHSTWTTVMPSAYRAAQVRRRGSARITRSHWVTIASRMITYPMTTTRRSPRSNAAEMPEANTSTPAICTSVVIRYGPSSVSYAEANQVKFIQAHQMPKNISRYHGSARSMSPVERAWCRRAAASETATTKHRSKNSSSGVEARCSSSARRAVIGRSQGRWSVWVTARTYRRCGVPVTGRVAGGVPRSYRPVMWRHPHHRRRRDTRNAQALDRGPGGGHPSPVLAARAGAPDDRGQADRGRGAAARHRHAVAAAAAAVDRAGPGAHHRGARAPRGGGG